MATKATKNVEKAKLEEVKEVAVRGLPPEGLSMASGDGYGAKNFAIKELEATIRGGVALEPALVHPLRSNLNRPPQPQLSRICLLLSN